MGNDVTLERLHKGDGCEVRERTTLLVHKLNLNLNFKRRATQKVMQQPLQGFAGIEDRSDETRVLQLEVSLLARSHWRDGAIRARLALRVNHYTGLHKI